MISGKDLSFIAKECNTKSHTTQTVIEMFEQGLTVPFISRYRKEKTNSLNEISVQLIFEKLEFINELNERKLTVTKTIDSLNKLTPELKETISQIFKKSELEDFYLPYKPSKKSKASEAVKQGLEPLANLILIGNNTKTIDSLALSFIDEQKGISSTNEALAGVGYIIQEKFSNNTELRKFLRKIIVKHGIFKVTVTPDFKDLRTNYEQYYNYSTNLKDMLSYRFLAILRGNKEKILKYNISIDEEKYLKESINLIKIFNHCYEIFLKEILKNALKKSILPSLNKSIITDLKEIADEKAIEIFAKNFEKLLLSPPAGEIRTLAVDPAFRTGCKLTALDEHGILLHNCTVYPNAPQNKILESQKTVENILKRFQLAAIVIGNGTASRETYSFFKKFVSDKTILTIVDEAGASIYSASKVGIEEFPIHDITVRGSVSIGRRFQDPLSELVKIEPKSIGVGQYQHDVNQKDLKNKLNTVVRSVVNRIGVDLNTSSQYLLQYVAGISNKTAENIIKYRTEKGAFKKRVDLLKIPGFGEKAFLQSSGFLRIRNGAYILDSTRIHPESYLIVEQISKTLALPVNQLIGNVNLKNKIKPEQLITEQFQLPTITDIIDELISPAIDVRENFEIIQFKDGINDLKDLSEGMIVNGIVTNVTDFGAFVDIGVHQDGLVHKSELSHSFIKDPNKIISVSQKITVKIIKIDLKLKRIGLSIKALTQKVKHQPRPKPVRKPKTNSVDSLKNIWNSK